MEVKFLYLENASVIASRYSFNEATTQLTGERQCDCIVGASSDADDFAGKGGVYKNGNIELAEIPQGISESRVIVTDRPVS